MSNPAPPAYDSGPPPPYNYNQATGGYYNGNKSQGHPEPPTQFGAQPPPPPPGWSPYQYNPQSYGAITVEPVPVIHGQVILIGGCPSCRVGVLEDEFSCLGVLCAILFFPLGILCCLAFRDKRCTNCGARF